jgi:membrane fusion protein, multidrug efflux system
MLDLADASAASDATINAREARLRFLTKKRERILERNLLGGEYAYEQAPIMIIAQINPLNVEVFVPIALYGAVKTGTEASVSGEQPVGRRYTATVEVIDPLIDSRSGTFGIRLLLPNPDNKIPAGLRCKIEFPAGL